MLTTADLTEIVKIDAHSFLEKNEQMAYPSNEDWQFPELLTYEQQETIDNHKTHRDKTRIDKIVETFIKNNPLVTGEILS